MKRQTLEVLPNLGAVEIADVMLGKSALDADRCARFALCMYPHPTPGRGSGAQIRFDPTQAGADPNDAPLIILAHDLIHAWRMIRGLRIFESGREEEAMATGLPPFTTLRFTEDRLRVETGPPVREDHVAKCATKHFEHVTRHAGSA